MATKMQVPPADIEQIIKAAETIELHGRIYVDEVRSTDTNQVCGINLSVDVWPEGFNTAFRGKITWTLWGDQCDTKGKEIKQLYHGHSGLVIVRGIHMGKSYTDKNGMVVDKIEATSFDFSKFGAGLTSPDVAALEARVAELEADVTNFNAWIAWVSQYTTAIQQLPVSAPAPAEATEAI